MGGERSLEAKHRSARNESHKTEIRPDLLVAAQEFADQPTRELTYASGRNKMPDFGRWKPWDEYPKDPKPGPHHVKNALEASGLMAYFFLTSTLFVKNGGLLANAGIMAAVWPFVGSLILGMVLSRWVSITATSGPASWLAKAGLFFAGIIAVALPIFMITLSPVFLPVLTGLGLGFYIGDLTMFRKRD